jgi:hypothetical protein
MFEVGSHHGVTKNAAIAPAALQCGTGVFIWYEQKTEQNE